MATNSRTIPKLRSKRRLMKKKLGRSRLPRWAGRLLAVGLGCLPLLLCELVLQLTAWPRQPPVIDPLVDLHHLRPLFTPSADGQTYSIGPERMNLFRPASFAAEKPKGTFRVFALGGSTTQGEPYSTPTAFPQWLRLDLEVATATAQSTGVPATNETIEVINCGGLSYASYRVKAILAEVLQYQPDLILVDCGQNEFLEQRSYEGWRDVPLPLARANSWLQRLKVVQFARWLVQGQGDRSEQTMARATELQHEVDALLDYQGGLEHYHRDDQWREPVTAHFRWNMAQMVEQCQSAHVPVVLMRPVVNLLDCPPMKFETRPDLSPALRDQFESAWASAQTHAAEPSEARKFLAVASEIDPDHAGVNFFLGRLAWEAEQWEDAASLLRRAKDQDVCPLRALTSIQDAVSEIAREYDVPLLDAEKLFSDRSPHGIVGNHWLVDHVHPNIEGHQLLGQALCELCLQQGWLIERDVDWREKIKEAQRAHLRSLGEDYFQRGKQRLEGLLLWTQGRAKKIRP